MIAKRSHTQREGKCVFRGCKLLDENEKTRTDTIENRDSHHKRNERHRICSLKMDANEIRL